MGFFLGGSGGKEEGKEQTKFGSLCHDTVTGFNGKPTTSPPE